MRRVGLRTAAHADRLPGHPDVATRGAFASAAFRRQRCPRPRGSDDIPVHHLVPYRLDTPTTSQVSPRDHRMFSEGWKNRHPLVIRSAQLCQRRVKQRIRRCRRNPTSASPTVTAAPGASSADARCFLSVESLPRGLGVPTKLPEENLDGSSSRSKRCETNVGHRGGFQCRDGVATTPTDQHV
jgi:hypothetical protein